MAKIEVGSSGEHGEAGKTRGFPSVASPWLPSVAMLEVGCGTRTHIIIAAVEHAKLVFSTENNVPRKNF